tara:strand:+ start:837 stop:1037 length:201 start_codon:yes stop_codon:yes gene_type:complete
VDARKERHAKVIPLAVRLDVSPRKPQKLPERCLRVKRQNSTEQKLVVREYLTTTRDEINLKLKNYE